jgi:hypothetical protein
MICHLNDAFKVPLGQRNVSVRSNLFTRTVLKWIAIRVPLKWAKGFKTMPEIDQQIGGTRPGEFEKDMVELKNLVKSFAQQDSGFEWHVHPVFGAMTGEEWLRWGYLHADHHLRQFGV